MIHRDYSLTDKDIKIAIFDDKIKITSPGKLLPSIDFEDMKSGQSDIRNKVLAPVFKKMGIIEQWGSGLQLISNELKKYPEIALKWNEPGTAFRVSFVKENFEYAFAEPQIGIFKEGIVPYYAGTKMEPRWGYVCIKVGLSKPYMDQREHLNRNLRFCL